MTDGPHDRLTRIADEMLSVLDERLERENLKAILFLSDDVERRSAIGIRRYTGEALEDAARAATVDLFMHLQAMFEGMGKKLMFVPLHGGPEAN